MNTLFLTVLAAILLPVSAYADGRAPVYLFADWRYWLFLALYALITAKLVQWIRILADNRDAAKPFPLRDVSWAATFLLFNALIYQILHHFEHVSQIFQWWYLGEHRTVAKGIIFFLDLEWNHFIFDSVYFLMLASACLLFFRQWKQKGHTLDEVTKGLIIATIGVQGWHAVEHTYRIIQHVRIGCEPCAGISDTVFHVPLIPLHFWFNVLALTFPLLLFFWLRMEALMKAFFKEFGARVQSMFRAPAVTSNISERPDLGLAPPDVQQD